MSNTFDIHGFAPFRSGEKINNVIEHVQQFRFLNPNTKIIIGTDSQDRMNITRFTSVVIMPYEAKRGSHVIEHKDIVPRIPDVFTRLHEEVRRSLELAELLGGPKKIWAIHCDYNGAKSAKSYANYEAGLGWARSMGYRAFGKPLAFGASSVADYTC